MKPPSDRDAPIDFAELKALLVTQSIRTMRIFRLYFDEGRTAKQVAAVMGMSETSVRSIIKRTRRKLAAFRNGALSPRFDPELRGEEREC